MIRTTVKLRSPRTLAARTDSAKFIGEPQEAYDHICKVLQAKQTHVEDAFFIDDEEMPLASKWVWAPFVVKIMYADVPIC